MAEAEEGNIDAQASAVILLGKSSPSHNYLEEAGKVESEPDRLSQLMVCPLGQPGGAGNVDS